MYSDQSNQSFEDLNKIKESIEDLSLTKGQSSNSKILDANQSKIYYIKSSFRDEIATYLNKFNFLFDKVSGDSLEKLIDDIDQLIANLTDLKSNKEKIFEDDEEEHKCYLVLKLNYDILLKIIMQLIENKILFRSKIESTDDQLMTSSNSSSKEEVFKKNDALFDTIMKLNDEFSFIEKYETDEIEKNKKSNYIHIKALNEDLAESSESSEISEFFESSENSESSKSSESSGSSESSECSEITESSEDRFFC